MPLVAGESGVAGLAALQRLAAQASERQAVGLDAGARVLLISTEGATAPGVYAGIVGCPAQQVQAAQQGWLRRAGMSRGRAALPSAPSASPNPLPSQGQP